MNITESAKQYAQGKALEAITAAIEKAYQDGYNDGVNHLELEKMEAAKTGVNYVDLGLPSGTLWSSGYLYDNPEHNNYELVGYLDASKLNIPTKEQYEELYKFCKVFKIYEKKNSAQIPAGAKFVGKNSNSIIIPSIRIEHLNASLGFEESFYFWIRGDKDGDEKNCAGAIADDQDLKKAPISKIFMGLKLPVMLVK